MALIPCPECKKEISDQAEACPNCGFPLNRKNPFDLVCIKTPERQYDARFSPTSPQQIVILNKTGKLLWQGLYGEIAHFIISFSQIIHVLLVDQKYPLEFLVRPGRCYELIYLSEERTYTLNEF